jgi:cytochrome c biogenesis protein
LEKQRGLVEIVTDKIWKFLSSVKLAVVLLIILAIVSIIGTVIAQNESPEKYLREYSQTTVNLFEAIGLFDMYHTWWFVLLLFLLTANLTVCTLDRFPHTWKIIKAPLKPIEDEGLKALPFKKEIVFKGGMDKAEERAAKVLVAHRYRFIESRGAGTVQLMTQKGVFSRFGVYITHASIVLVFIGALMGSFFGFKGYLPLEEDEHSDVVYLRNAPMWDRIMESLGIGKSMVVRNPQSGEFLIPLGYYIRCDKFDVDYYLSPGGGPTGMPSEYYSDLSIFGLNRQKLFDKRITVNGPLTYQGITFYQSSYGAVPNAHGKIELNIQPKKALSSGENVFLDPGTATYVPSIDRTLRITGISPFGVRNAETGNVMFYQAQNNEMVNPVVELEVFKGKGKTLAYKTHVMKADSQPYMPEDYSINYVHSWGMRYTVLQVAKDPGVWVVYAGFILLCIGPLIAFFGSHKKLWVRLQDRKGQAVVTVAGSANRNRIGFEREINRIVGEIEK